MIIRAKAAGRLGEVKRAKGKGTHFKYLLERKPLFWTSSRRRLNR
jgi:hypothetical protein